MKILSIYKDNFEEEEMQKLSSIGGDQFHFLIRRIADVAFSSDFGITELEAYELMVPKSIGFEYLYFEEKYIDGLRLENGLEIKFESEMLGIQVFFDQQTSFKEAVIYAQEITQSLIEQTKSKAELCLILD